MPDDRPVAVRARGLGIDGRRGPVFDGVDLEVRAGSLLVVAGRAGTGRTSLLLALAGRMLPSRGRLEVLGHPLPAGRRAVRHLVTLGTVRGVNDLDAALTVEEHVLERLALTSPWWRLLVPSGHDVPAVLAAVDDGAHAPLAPGAVVRDLDPYDAFRLGVALALADRRRQHPHLLAVDDVDDLRDPAAVTAAWRLLAALAGSYAEPGGGPGADPADGLDRDPVPGGLTVVATCSDAASLPAGVRVAEDTVVEALR